MPRTGRCVIYPSLFSTAPGLIHIGTDIRSSANVSQDVEFEPILFGCLAHPSI